MYPMQPKNELKKESPALPEKLAQSKVHKAYNLGEVLTEDVTGTIYAAKTRLKGEAVAVNVLAPNCTVTSKKLIRIEHPNICKAHNVLKLADGTLAIVIESPKGKPILEFMRDNSPANAFAAGQAISAILQLLSALHAIHNTEKTARNLNVNNIFLYKDSNKNLKLKLVSIGIGGSGVNLKAPHYLSPERIMDVDKGDLRADIWAAGAIFYHLCFGRPPFAGKDAVEVAKKNMLEAPDFDIKGRVIPEALIDIIKKAIHRDENKRYQTVSEMVGDLLPLRERYKEPMSTEVKTALKNSYPPPPPKGRLVPKKPTRKDATGLQTLHKTESKPERKDATVEYGTRKKSAPKTIATPRRFFGAEISRKKSTELGPKKPEVSPGRRAPNMTLLGIPAVTTTPIKSATSDISPASPKRSAPKTAPARQPEKRDSLFSPRSILGSEEEIKQLEEEMDFLEDRDDGDIPTLVASEKNLAAMMTQAKDTRAAAPAPEAKAVEPPPQSPTAEAVPPIAPSEPPTQTIDEVSDADILQSDSIQPRSTIKQPPSRPAPALLTILKEKRQLVIIGGVAVAAVFAFIIGIVSVSSGPSDSDKDTQAETVAATESRAGKAATTPLEAATAKETVPTAAAPPAATVTEVEVQTAELADPPPKETETNEASAKEAPEAAPAPEPERVSINFQNVPKHHTVKINGKPTVLPIEMDRTKEICTVVISADGYETFKVRVVPDRDREIPIRMAKAPDKKKKKKKKRSGGKAKKAQDSLVSNPFKK